MSDAQFTRTLSWIDRHPTPLDIRAAIFEAIDEENTRRASAGEPLIEVGVWRVIRAGIAKAHAEHDARNRQ